MWRWFTDYIGTIQFDPTKELAEIPDHSAFFILSPDNRYVCVAFCPATYTLAITHTHKLSLIYYPFFFLLTDCCAVFVCSATSWCAPRHSTWSPMSPSSSAVCS